MTSKRKKIHDKETQNKTPLVLTYNFFFPNISNIVRKHWNIVNISRTFQGLFEKERITVFKRNRNLKELIGSIGKCFPCLSKTSNLCFSHLTSTTTNKKKI